MGVFRPKPRVVRPHWGHPILRGQTLWMVANDKDPAPKDILHGAYAATTVKSAVAYKDSAWGSAWDCDNSAAGSTTGYIDLGSTNRFLASDTTPFTVAWVEHSTGARSSGGVMGLFPTSAAKQFFVFRTSATSIAAGFYGHLACGPWNNTGSVPCWLGPPKLSDSLPLVFVITGLAGTSSQTFANWSVYWGGSISGKETSSSGANSGNLGSTANSFGWETADVKFPGMLDNMRVWNRVLSDAEIKAIIDDPYVGCARPASPVFLRFPKGLLSGTVTAAGSPIVGATVRAMHADGRIVETTITDGSGNYAFASNQIDPGSLHDIVVVGPSGYDSAIHQGITPGSS